MTAALLLALAAAAGAADPAAASPAPTSLAEARSYLQTYQQDPARIDLAKAFLQDLPKRDAATETSLSEAWFLLGDLRAKDNKEREADYAAGRDAGERAVTLDPKSPDAHIWFAINTGRWGQARGTMKSLFLLKTLRREIKTVLELDPKQLRARSLSANIDMEVPGLLGGSLSRSEKSFRDALALDPHYTAARLGLAKCLIKQKRTDEARKELQAVLDETSPLLTAYWTLKDVPEARSLLQGLPPAKR